MAPLAEKIQVELRSHEMFATEDFAKYMTSALDARLLTPIVELEDCYHQASIALNEGAFLRRDLEQFIRAGRDHIKIAIDKQSDNFFMSAHSVRQLKEAMTDLQLIHWVPSYIQEAQTYAQENMPGMGTRLTVMWKWNTVPIERMASREWHLIARYMSEYKASLQENRVADSTKFHGESTTFGQAPKSGLALQLEKLGSKKIEELVKVTPSIAQEQRTSAVEEQDVVEEDTTVLSDELRDELEFQHLLNKERSEQVRFSMMVAQRYLNKARNAMRRELEFALTIDDFTTLMRSHVCYYTRQPLVTQFSEEDIRLRRIPENYLSIERLDSNKGYTRDNTVVCSHSINVTKQSSTEAEFRQILSISQLMSNLTEEQKRMLLQLNKM